jgi:serine protease AprX
MVTITINGHSIDPIAEPTPSPSNDSQSNYILIQTKPSLTDERRAELAGLGVTILEYLPRYSYLCRYEKSDLQPIRNLTYIAWAADYSRRFKLSPDLSATNGGGAKTVDVVFHADVNPESLRGQIAAKANFQPADLKLGRRKARLTIDPACFADLADIDDVRHIEEVRPSEFLDNVAREILGIGPVNGNSEIPFEGEGQIVVVADSGFDIGREDNVHEAFMGGPNGTSRVIKLYKIGRPADEEHGIPGSADDPIGHGTHVSGSVLGDGESTQFGKVRGTAPKARLIVQSLLDENNKLRPPVDLHQLFLPPYTEFGARIHNNSWGSSPGEGVYDQQSFEVDDFIWTHRDFVVCFAAGNEGRDHGGDGIVDSGSITAPGTAKNCITVGATENDRSNFSKTYGEEFPGRFQSGPLADDRMADNKDSIAALSSRGPTKDKRFKPDVVAPGTFILSALSRVRDPGLAMLAAGDLGFYFHAGTSMASPLVAGCAALVREFLDKSRGIKNPSAALVKAALINGARAVNGQDPSLLPNSEQGFGRVDMAATVEPFPQGVSVEFRDEAAPLAEQKDDVIPLTIEPVKTSLKVTLVWTDPPGESLQNDLDLIVKTAGEERHGNQPPTARDFDRANNVEQVIWNNVPADKVEIIVKAARIKKRSQPQPYALVIRTVKSSI